MKEKLKLLIITTIIFIIDRISKLIIIKNINNLGISILNNTISIIYTENEGCAWSLLEGHQLFLILITIIFLILITNIAIKETPTKINIIKYGLILGGGLGNLFDRIIYNHVIDFISIKIITYNFPIFNLADLSICIGTILLIIELIRSEIHERTNSR